MPSGKEYTWPKAVTSATLSEIQRNAEQLNMKWVYDALMNFATVNFTALDEKVNTIEMMALYQQAFTLLGTPLKVDWFFGGATRVAVKKFQEKNGLVGDGIPWQKTTETLLRKLSEKWLSSNPMKEVMKNLEITPEDNKNVVRIIKEARKNPLPGSNQYSSYSGNNFDNIEYAYVKQPDGWYYVFGERSTDTPVWRHVYQTDKDFNILDVAKVEGGGKISSRKWKILEAPFNPAPIIKKK